MLQLHEDFLNMLKEYPTEIVSFSETKSTLVTALKVPFQFVTANSAGMIFKENFSRNKIARSGTILSVTLCLDPGVGEFFEIAQDHLSICKPASR